jgi:hypothetical protein
VVATGHGRRVLAGLDERFAEAERHLLSALPSADQAQLRRLLRELAIRANASGPVPTCNAVEDITARDHG